VTPWQAAILGLVEGITEYLPISSTGHLVLTGHLLGLDEPEDLKQAVDAFLIAIQGGAILAVLGLYRDRVVQMIRGLLGRDPAGRRLVGLLLVAFAPAAVLGPILNDAIEAWLFHPAPVIAALSLGGVAMIAIGRHERRDARVVDDLTWRGALVIGLAQCLSMWPGVSRSGATIVAGVLAGLRRRDAAEFSFLLGLPTLGGACVYRVAKSAMAGDQSLFEFGWLALGIGFGVATVSAAIAVKWLVSWLNRRGLAVFGWYRIGLAVVYGVWAR